MNSLEYKIHRWSIVTPNKTALINKNASYNYKDLFENIWASKRFLESSYNISKGDIIVLAASKSVTFIFVYLYMCILILHKKFQHQHK